MMKPTIQAMRSTLDILPALNHRFSPRAFSDREVTEEELELLFEAARWAPSSMNEQPWRFLVVRRGDEGHAALLSCLSPKNASWADKAPVLVVNMVMRDLSRNGQPNHHARHDLGLALGQFTAQATELGMGLHLLGGFSAEATREAFHIPESLDIVCVTVLGFPGDPDQLPEDLRAREVVRSPRKTMSELVHKGRFHG